MSLELGIEEADAKSSQALLYGLFCHFQQEFLWAWKRLGDNHCSQFPSSSHQYHSDVAECVFETCVCQGHMQGTHVELFCCWVLVETLHSPLPQMGSRHLVQKGWIVLKC